MCLHLELSLNFHPAPRWNVRVCSCGWQNGGGLIITGTATLTNTNVYSNGADEVSSPFELSMSFHPHCPAETHAHSRSSWQGGGVYVSSGGKATLIDSNVHANLADPVCSPV